MLCILFTFYKIIKLWITEENNGNIIYEISLKSKHSQQCVPCTQKLKGA